MQKESVMNTFCISLSQQIKAFDSKILHYIKKFSIIIIFCVVLAHNGTIKCINFEYSLKIIACKNKLKICSNN